MNKAIHPGYLHNWIQANYKRIWSSRITPPRFLGTRDVSIFGQGDFLTLGKELVSKMGTVQQDSKGLPIQFEILDIESEGAWVVWPAQCYGVLFTKGLLWKLQRISWELQRMLPETFTVPVKHSNFFKDLWADVPQDEEHFQVFGSLVCSTAFTFIVHHELAHAGLGHEGLRFLHRKLDEAEAGGNMTEIKEEFMDEYTGVLSSALRNDNFLRSQAVETDADVHGMFYTRRLLHEQATRLRNIQSADGEKIHKVSKGLLRNADCEQLMLFIGIAVGLLALLPDLGADRVEATEYRTHPPLPSRLLLAMHVAGSIDGYTKKFWENRSAAITAALIAIDAFQKEEFGKGIGRWFVKSTDAAEIAVDASLAGMDRWKSFSHVSIIDAMRRPHDLGPYWEELVAEVRRLTPHLAPYARFPSSLRYEWHKASLPELGTTNL